MGFLHVLLAIALTFTLVRAGSVLALVHRWRGRMLVIGMAVTLFFSGPPVLVILAGSIAALPGSRMCLLVLSKIAWPLENLTALAALLRVFPSSLR